MGHYGSKEGGEGFAEGSNAKKDGTVDQDLAMPEYQISLETISHRDKKEAQCAICVFQTMWPMRGTQTIVQVKDDWEGRVLSCS